MNYYNEFDKFAAAWLRDLIARRLIPAGHVDTRSIVDVSAGDLDGYTQCHFFAGIGGWPYALRLAGIDPSTRLWTGSCPCQPFSSAGKRKGTDDERHLWPVFRNLIAECKPPIIFGEQVASADGRDWLSNLRNEMEALDYAVGAADLCAAGIGAPHIRQRLYFVGMANPYSKRYNRINPLLWKDKSRWDKAEDIKTTGCCEISGMANSDSGRFEQCDEGLGVVSIANKNVKNNDTNTINSQWRNADWLHCRDGKWRPVEPGTFPLANGISGRVGRLRGYGNAIVPQVAAIFIKSALC